MQRAVRDDRWKLIVYPQINKTQLFDLQNDPHEVKDLAGDPAQAQQIERLTGLLQESGSSNSATRCRCAAKSHSPAEFDFSKVAPEAKKEKKKKEQESSQSDEPAMSQPSARAVAAMPVLRSPFSVAHSPVILASTFAPISTPEKPPLRPKMSYLDNGTIKLGIDLSLGGRDHLSFPLRRGEERRQQL